MLFTERTLNEPPVARATRCAPKSLWTGLGQPTRRSLDPEGVQRLMEDLSVASGLPRGRLTPHVLRHNFAMVVGTGC